METLDYILSINPNYITIGLLTIFFTIEQLAGTGKDILKRGKHLFHNVLFQITLVLLNIFFISILIYAIEWLNKLEIGLLYFINLPFWVKLIVSVMLYDLSTYWIHRASHKVPLLWRLHRVHHSDTQMDSTTTFRFHPLELIIIYQTGNILTALIFGTDLLSLSVYYLVLNIFFFFEHANLKYPTWINNTLGLLFVMPDHHRIHHHQEQYYTDSNFSDIFILWDRIFGTYKFIPSTQVRYGLAEFDQDDRQTFLFLMKSPFIDIKNKPSETSNKDELNQ